MKINMKESSIIKPAKEIPEQILKSSVIDLLFPNYYTPFIYFYKPDGSKNFFNTRLLKEGLSNCLVEFYPAAGRLRRREEGSCGFDIDCNGEGVLFVEAESDSVIDDFGDFSPCPNVHQLIPTVDIFDEYVSHPLVVLQITHFKCGGASIGVRFNHILADGMSTTHFINAWSNMTRGLSVTIPPFYDRSLLYGRDPPSITYHHTEFDPPPSMNNPVQAKECQTNLDTTTIAIIKITRDQLNTLKENSKDDKSSERYSTYETLAAHVWRCTCIARGLGDDQATKLYIPMDVRSRLHPPLPAGYFGNAIISTTALALSGELQSNPLNFYIGKIHDALSQMDNDYLRSAIDFLAMQKPHPLPRIQGGRGIMCPNLNIVSWVRMPIHDANFGWGRPIHMGPTNVPFEGNVVILPSPTGDGSMSVLICLEADHMEVFKTVFYDF